MTVGDDILTIALDLPARQRAELARKLLLSLETPDFDVDAEQAWATEIEHRAAAADDDDAAAIDWRPAIERIRKTLRGEKQP